ncbi:MAG: ABC transporter substrate-binding protein [Coriobacteriales bacterium]|jgi:polar amino acid transport system substrate-binding protein|nr:ABC transporter substrate-binding protein [Coriobacteriales bacterium]
MSVSKKGLALLAALVLALSMALVGCGGGSKGAAETPPPATGDTPAPAPEEGLATIESGKILVGSDCDYPPFIYMEGDQVAGFEYELALAIGADLGYTVEYLPPQNFDTLIASVAAHSKMDIGFSSFTITDERKELVDFSIPYFDSNQACVVMKGSSYASTNDLAGLTVGAQSGTTGESWAAENIPDATIKGYNQTSEALAALVAGDVEAIFFDEPVAVEQVETTYTDCEIIEVIPTGEQYGIAVSKDNPALLDAINTSLQKLIADGTYATLFSKYFDFEPTIK